MPSWDSRILSSSSSSVPPNREREREREREMGEVKHIVLAKFKDGVSQPTIDDLIKGYANLVNRIQPMKSFQWGRDVSIENLHEGFTHVFESTFETTEGLAEYVAHSAHVEFTTQFLPHADKALVIDYKPTIVQIS